MTTHGLPLRRVARVLLAGVLAAALTLPSAAAFPKEVREQSIAATVKIYSLDDDLQPVASGSGSILTNTGQILTNYHVVGNNDTGELENKDGLVQIWVTTDARKPPVPQFIAKVVRSDPALDLALVTVVSDMSGNDLTGCLNLPTYTLGDSETVTPGDRVAVIGFPGIGGNSVTYTEGTISGYDNGPGGPWLKTDTEVNHGNSGGSAIDESGKLIGVPSAGVSDREDIGKISLIRPIASASEVLANVSTLGVPGCKGGPSLGEVPELGEEGVAAIGFLGYTGEGDGEITSAPSGAKALYAIFAYAAVGAQTPLTAQWLLNGKPVSEPERSETFPFEAGDGRFPISLTNEQGLADGEYTLKVTLGSEEVTTPGITVGGAGEDGEEAESVSIKGQVLSADSGEPIAEAIFVALAPGVTFEQWDPDDPEQVVAFAMTDANGNFQSEERLSLKEKYTLAVGAEGYRADWIDGADLNAGNPTNGFVDLGPIELKKK